MRATRTAESLINAVNRMLISNGANKTTRMGMDFEAIINLILHLIQTKKSFAQSYLQIMQNKNSSFALKNIAALCLIEYASNLHNQGYWLGCNVPDSSDFRDTDFILILKFLLNRRSQNLQPDHIYFLAYSLATFGMPDKARDIIETFYRRDPKLKDLNAMVGRDVIFARTRNPETSSKWMEFDQKCNRLTDAFLPAYLTMLCQSSRYSEAEDLVVSWYKRDQSAKDGYAAMAAGCRDAGNMQRAYDYLRQDLAQKRLSSKHGVLDLARAACYVADIDCMHKLMRRHDIDAASIIAGHLAIYHYGILDNLPVHRFIDMLKHDPKQSHTKDWCVIRLLWEDGRFEEMRKCAIDAARKYPDHHNFFLSMPILLLCCVGQLELASSLLEIALSEQNRQNDGNYLIALGIAAGWLGNNDRASTLLNIVFKRQPWYFLKNDYLIAQIIGWLTPLRLDGKNAPTSETCMNYMTNILGKKWRYYRAIASQANLATIQWPEFVMPWTSADYAAQLFYAAPN